MSSLLPVTGMKRIDPSQPVLKRLEKDFVMRELLSEVFQAEGAQNLDTATNVGFTGEQRFWHALAACYNMFLTWST